jgi:drug/metabolite transporter (DMT)-like permease
LVVLTLPFLNLPRNLPSINTLSAVMVLAIFPSALAQLLFIPLIARIGPTRAMSVSFLIPLFSILWGVAFLQESIGSSSLLGGLTVLSAIALVMHPNSLRSISP